MLGNTSTKATQEGEFQKNRVWATETPTASFPFVFTQEK